MGQANAIGPTSIEGFYYFTLGSASVISHHSALSYVVFFCIVWEPPCIAWLRIYRTQLLNCREHFSRICTDIYSTGILIALTVFAWCGKSNMDRSVTKSEYYQGILQRLETGHTLMSLISLFLCIRVYSHLPLCCSCSVVLYNCLSELLADCLQLLVLLLILYIKHSIEVIPVQWICDNFCKYINSLWNAWSENVKWADRKPLHIYA